MRDPIRITGTELPKRKLVKLQAQSVHFLEISDPKAVYENILLAYTRNSHLSLVSNRSYDDATFLH